MTYDNETIDRGDTRTLTASVSVDGAATDPATLTLTIRTPAGVSTTYTYGDDADVVRDSAGEYSYELTFLEAGPYTYEWRSTEPSQVQGETIQVQPSPLDVDAPTFTGFASLDDLALRLGFASAADLTAAQVAQGEMLLLAASGLIVDAVDRDDTWAAALTTVPAVLRAVCLEMVARVMQNPSGVRSQSETLGQHSRSASFTDNAHGLTITDAEERMCRRTAIGATSGSAYVDSIITEMAPATSLAVLLEAGPNDPPVYDWTN